MSQSGRSLLPRELKSIASTDDSFNDRVTATNNPNYFEDVQFADESTLVSLNHDRVLRSFVLPSNDALMNVAAQPHQLRASAAYQSPSTVGCYATLPLFHLANATPAYLCASTGLPIFLRDVANPSIIRATYPWIHPTTEEYTLARCIAFTSAGFVVGAKNEIAFFDASRNGQGPVTSLKLKGAVQSSTSMNRQGLVFGLGNSVDGLLAVGTTQREVAIYDSEGLSECVTVFDTAPPTDNSPPTGAGVTSLKWSPCGTYLLIAERQSDSILVYDIRNTVQRVSTLNGRNAMTTQKLGFTIAPMNNGLRIWAGGTDGKVRAWDCVESTSGLCAPTFELALHRSAVSSVLWKPDTDPTMVLVSCSGERESEDEPDCSLQLWHLSPQTPPSTPEY